MPPRGLYETLITRALQHLLTQLAGGLSPATEALRPAEIADRLALHVGRAVQRVLDDASERDRLRLGLELVDQLLKAIADRHGVGILDELLPESGLLLRAIVSRTPDGSLEVIQKPLIPLLDTALLTNAPGEPRLGSQVLAEVHSADRIDLVMAFVRRSGIKPLLDALRSHCSSGRGLRVLTTTYTGSTEVEALDQLRDLGAAVRVSYDTGSTRLHAKSWLFHRESGFSTAYIGSSNLTHSAQVTGLEWNVRVSGTRNPDVVEKVAAVFESYWHGGEFVPYERSSFELHAARAKDETTIYLSPLELRPEPFQDRLLEQLALSRERGHHRNLLVSATGTGKTVMAAIDYARLRERIKRIDHVQHNLETQPNVPLRVHARYTRVEILAGFGIGSPAKVDAWQSGVLWAEHERADLLAFTLDKTSGQFSPTTRYRDYAISRELIHWESQSVTRAGSDTGIRYQTHEHMKTSIMLFARLRQDDRAFWFLGPASYVKHESETPMGVTWRLKHPLPGDLFELFAAAVA